ncbi:MAG TPA: hypothetical protein VEO54_17450 [Thermoanaerobaculia bacterium]|nr:hypothetical protein [Thermoanaerobaculia bacterium]
MRTLTVVLATILMCGAAVGQQRVPPRRPAAMMGPGAAENGVRQAAERLGNERKGIEITLRGLQHIRNSDRALIDPMQPAIAVQKAFEELSEAERLILDPALRAGLIRARQALEAARNSPATADFGRLRATVRTEALGPVSRAVIRSATGLHEETLAWIAVQEQIATHLKTLSEITGESLRAAQEE